MNSIVTAIELIVRVLDLINGDPTAMGLIAQLEADLGVGTGITPPPPPQTGNVSPASRFTPVDPNDPRIQKHQ